MRDGLIQRCQTVNPDFSASNYKYNRDAVMQSIITGRDIVGDPALAEEYEAVCSGKSYIVPLSGPLPTLQDTAMVTSADGNTVDSYWRQNLLTHMASRDTLVASTLKQSQTTATLDNLAYASCTLGENFMTNCVSFNPEVPNAPVYKQRMLNNKNVALVVDNHTGEKVYEINPEPTTLPTSSNYLASSSLSEADTVYTLLEGAMPIGIDMTTPSKTSQLTRTTSTDSIASVDSTGDTGDTDDEQQDDPSAPDSTALSAGKAVTSLTDGAIVQHEIKTIDEWESFMKEDHSHSQGPKVAVTIDWGILSRDENKAMKQLVDVMDLGSLSTTLPANCTENDSSKLWEVCEKHKGMRLRLGLDGEMKEDYIEKMTKLGTNDVQVVLVDKVPFDTFLKLPANVESAVEVSSREQAKAAALKCSEEGKDVITLNNPAEETLEGLSDAIVEQGNIIKEIQINGSNKSLDFGSLEVALADPHCQVTEIAVDGNPDVQKKLQAIITNRQQRQNQSKSVMTASVSQNQPSKQQNYESQEDWIDAGQNNGESIYSTPEDAKRMSTESFNNPTYQDTSVGPVSSNPGYSVPVNSVNAQTGSSGNEEPTYESLEDLQVSTGASAGATASTSVDNNPTYERLNHNHTHEGSQPASSSVYEKLDRHNHTHEGRQPVSRPVYEEVDNHNHTGYKDLPHNTQSLPTRKKSNSEVLDNDPRLIDNQAETTTSFAALPGFKRSGSTSIFDTAPTTSEDKQMPKSNSNTSFRSRMTLSSARGDEAPLVPNTNGFAQGVSDSRNNGGKQGGGRGGP